MTVLDSIDAALRRLSGRYGGAQWQALTEAVDAQARQCRDAQRRLGEAEQNLEVAVASLGAGLIVTDEQARVCVVNTEAQRLTGWTLEAARGRSVWEVFARADRPKPRLSSSPMDLLVDLGVAVDSAHHVTGIARDGRRHDLEVRAVLLHADDGTARGLLLVLRDITPVPGLAAASSRLAAIVESSYDAIIGKTLDGRITDWNQAAERLLGYSAPEAIGQPVQMLIPPDRQAEELRILADLAHGERVTAFDTVRLTKDGRALQVSITVSPIRDAAGRIVGASKIMRDVTRKRRMEAALRDSEARLRFTVESARIGDWDLDLDSGRMQHSLLHDRCFGHQTLQPDWTFDTFLARVHADDRETVRSGFHAAVSQWRDWQVECRVVWPDASVHWIRMHGGVPAGPGADEPRGRAGGPLAPPSHLRGIVSDITAQKCPNLPA